MEIRDKIKKKREAILKSIKYHGQTDGTEIATNLEMLWLAEQAARDGILLSYSEAKEVYDKEGESYYYYRAISVNAEKEDVRWFVEVYPLMPATELKRLMADTTDKCMLKNIKKVRNLVLARDRRRRKRNQEEERAMALAEIVKREEIEREEAADHRNDVEWLVNRIKSLGYADVKLYKKPK